MKALFLDRDGVLNVLRPNDYVKSPAELELLPQVAEALALLRTHFDLVIVVTNQQGIAKKLMTEDDLQLIHAKLMDATGGAIDRIYHCPDLASAHSFRRKPNIGMALQARRDFPGLRLKESVMVGDSLSDMLFGRRAGLHTVLITPTPSVAHIKPWLVDECHPSLYSYATTMQDRPQP